MTQAVAHGSLANPPSAPPRHAPHGQKRAAETSLEPEQRLSKRFDLLNLDTNGSRLYIPVPGSSSSSSSSSTSTTHLSHPIAHPDPLAFLPPRSKRPRAPRPATHDAMAVEDAPHRVYIADLNAELSDLESDEDTPIFLPDIERHLSRIPKHVLLGRGTGTGTGMEPKPTRDNQVVVYNVPQSLSVPQEQDGVRKAIVEARRRIREAQVSPITELGLDAGFGTGQSVVDIPPLPSIDADAMEID